MQSITNHEISSFRNSAKSIGYSSIQSPRQLIVFVHGFGGNAVNTWGEFRDIVISDNKFIHCDIIFYGYDSKTIQATTNGSILKQFMDIYSKPALSINGVSRQAPDKYERIIILAHSLGAFVVRKAMIHAYKSNQEWVTYARMILLAPAHNGSELPERVIESLPNLLKVTVSIARHFMPVIQDLQKDSRTIKTLIDETRALQETEKGNFTKAVAVAWAEDERVVINDDFCDDPAPITIYGKNHINICKPELVIYESPFDLLKLQL